MWHPIAAATSTAALLASSHTVGANPWLTLGNYGFAGLLIFFTFFKPKVHTSSEVRRLEQQVEQERGARKLAEDEVVRLHLLVEEQVIPALSRSTDLIARQLRRETRPE